MAITTNTYKIEDATEPYSIVARVEGFKEAVKEAKSLAARTGHVHYVMPMSPSKAGRVTEIRPPQSGNGR